MTRDVQQLFFPDSPASPPPAGSGVADAARGAMMRGRSTEIHLLEGDASDMADHTMLIGEALVGEGNEIAHIDLLIGSKSGPVGHAFASALANQSAGHSNLLAVLTPNLAVKPSTVLITKVTIKGMKQAVQMFGPAQYAVAKAVADCLAEGTIPTAVAEDIVIICGVFIHPAAEDNAKILKY